MLDVESYKRNLEQRNKIYRLMIDAKIKTINVRSIKSDGTTIDTDPLARNNFINSTMNSIKPRDIDVPIHIGKSGRDKLNDEQYMQKQMFKRIYSLFRGDDDLAEEFIKLIEKEIKPQEFMIMYKHLKEVTQDWDVVDPDELRALSLQTLANYNETGLIDGQSVSNPHTYATGKSLRDRYKKTYGSNTTIATNENYEDEENDDGEDNGQYNKPIAVDDIPDDNIPDNNIPNDNIPNDNIPNNVNVNELINIMNKNSSDIENDNLRSVGEHYTNSLSKELDNANVKMITEKQADEFIEEYQDVLAKAESVILDEEKYVEKNNDEDIQTEEKDDKPITFEELFNNMQYHLEEISDESIKSKMKAYVEELKKEYRNVREYTVDEAKAVESKYDKKLEEEEAKQNEPIEIEETKKVNFVDDDINYGMQYYPTARSLLSQGNSNALKTLEIKNLKEANQDYPTDETNLKNCVQCGMKYFNKYKPQHNRTKEHIALSRMYKEGYIDSNGLMEGEEGFNK